MLLSEVNSLDIPGLKDALRKCCGSESWVQKLAMLVPFASVESLQASAEKVWRNCSESDWLEAFKHHPKIGDLSSLKEKYSNTKDWASGEQSGVEKADNDVLERLSRGNNLYEEKFGFIFIVSASGKTAGQMLALLESRLLNDIKAEIIIAMKEQEKITRIRLQKLVTQ